MDAGPAIDASQRSISNASPRRMHLPGFATELIGAQLARRTGPLQIAGVFHLMDRFQHGLAVHSLYRQRISMQTTGQQHSGPDQSAEEICLGILCFHGARRDRPHRRQFAGF